jgi:hypothetical protein
MKRNRSRLSAINPHRSGARQPDAAAEGTGRFFRFLALTNERVAEPLYRPLPISRFALAGKPGGRVDRFRRQ